MQLNVKKVTQSFVVLMSVGLMAWLASAQQARGPAVTLDALINAAGDGTEWLSYGHDYAETHFSPLAEINVKNVKRLPLAWSAERQAPQGTVEATPLMHNGVLYGILPWNVMYAVDARTGQEKWRWDPEVPRQHIQGLCCGPVNRGVGREAVCVRDGSQQSKPSTVHVHARWRRHNASTAACGASAGKGRTRDSADADRAAAEVKSEAADYTDYADKSQVCF